MTLGASKPFEESPNSGVALQSERIAMHEDSVFVLHPGSLCFVGIGRRRRHAGCRPATAHFRARIVSALCCGPTR
jgi:hypothetical protein